MTLGFLLDDRDTYNALLADFVQYYHIDIRGLDDGSLDPLYIATLAFELPKGARIYARINPDLEYSNVELFLNSIEFMIRSTLAGLSGSTDEMHPVIVPKSYTSLQTQIDPEVKARVRAEILANAGGN